MLASARMLQHKNQATRLTSRIGQAADRRPRPSSVVLILFFLAISLAASAHAAPMGEFGVDKTAGSGKTSAEIEAAKTHKKPNGFVRGADAMHRGVTFAINRTALRVDSFFADDRFYADTTETYLRVSGRATWESGEDDKYQARVRMRMDLPGTRERWRLFVEGDDPEATADTGSDSFREALDDSDYNIGLEAQLRNTGRWDIRPGLGVKAASPPDPFVRIRAIRYERLRRWLMRFSAGAAEFVDDGTELMTRLDFDRRLNHDYLFRSLSRVRYRDSKDRTEVTQQFSLFQKVNNRVGLAYDVGVRVDDDPDWEVDHYFTQVRTRVRAYKKWLFLEFTPEVIVREKDNYDPSFRFSLRADAVFGERYR